MHSHLRLSNERVANNVGVLASKMACTDGKGFAVFSCGVVNADEFAWSLNCVVDD